MPELPEVETVRRGLEDHVVGRTVDTVRVLHPRAVRRQPAGAAEFETALTGRGLDSARRRGKYLWLSVGEDALLAHLGMSGQLLIVDPVQPLSPHVRICFTFKDGGPDLRFTDQRTFGYMCVVRDGAELPGPIAHIAPDPFEAAFDPAGLTRRLRTRHTGVKRALLDQSLISGVGNIYADEALWRARLHWARPTETLNGPLQRLHRDVHAENFLDLLLLQKFTDQLALAAAKVEHALGAAGTQRRHDGSAPLIVEAESRLQGIFCFVRHRVIKRSVGFFVLHQASKRLAK